MGRSDGVAGEVQFNSPQGLVWHDRALYVADTENHAIRKVVCLGGGGGGGGGGGESKNGVTIQGLFGYKNWATL